MSYDWKDKAAAERFSLAWFDDIDGRFIDAARLFAHDQAPFDRIIPFAALKGQIGPRNRLRHGPAQRALMERKPARW